MKKYLFIIFASCSLLVEGAPLKLQNVKPIMSKIFEQHIECKEFTPVIAKRAIKLYLAQFDTEGLYLLESDVLPYLELSDSQLARLTEDFKKGDFSIFVTLNNLIESSIARARSFRGELKAELLSSEIPIIDKSNKNFYSANVKEVKSKQRAVLHNFFSLHKDRSKIYNQERRSKLFEFWEKKIQNFENGFAFHMSDEKKMNLLTLRILKSFARSLDAHSAFFSEEEAYEMRLSLEKRFEGIGVVLGEGIDGVMIVDLIKGSPAASSGSIAVNDLLEEIDGKPLSNRSFEEVLNAMKSNGRGEIELGLKRLTANLEEKKWRVTLKRKVIDMKEEKVSWSYDRFEDGIIGKIVLPSFYENDSGETTEKDLKTAIRELKAKGTVKGLILDMRDNAGGFLSQAIRVASLFISNGVVVISKYSNGEMHYFRNIDGRQYYNGPMIVLTSKLSASASEIVAQALQDYGIALVVGDDRTFGKGSIQFQTVTDKNTDLFYKITVGRYYTASGKSAQIDGVVADIVVPSKLVPAEIGERFLEYPLPRDTVESAYLDPMLDIEPKLRNWLKKYYIPNIQKVVSFWKKMVPDLKNLSEKRMKNDFNYALNLAKIKDAKGDDKDKVGKEIDNLQMQEAINIVKDMIILEAKSRKAALSYFFIPTPRLDLA